MSDDLLIDGGGDGGGNGIGGRILDEPFDRALESRYLIYALSTITARALPDVRDGLKPVQRRIVHAMGELGLNATSSFKKCAKIVGDVMGKYHPHGDSAIYDAMVRLAQDFSVRYPLVDGQGNFGNVDGDGAAAYRYTEARLTPFGTALLEGVDEDAVRFRETYSQEDSEPVVLPAAFPNLLANGAMGIAVGMATNIPPHNASELINACLHLIKKPEASLSDIMAHIPGPDFPTGGLLIESPEAIAAAYQTGRGGFRMRARWSVEDLGRGMWQIVVTEIPYQVQKARLVEKLAELVDTKKAPLLGDIRDESAEDIRLVLEPRTRTIEPNVLMESLFRLSELESRFSMNLNVLDKFGTPRVMSLIECLKAFLDHKREVICARATWRIGKIATRLEILDALMVVFLNLDEVIRIIREEDDPKEKLIEAFNLTPNQANAVLDTRLRNLRKLEEMALREEHAALLAEQKALNALLADPAAQWQKTADELAATLKLFTQSKRFGPRRTTIEAAGIEATLSVDAFIVKEPITVVLSEMGWIRAMKGRVDDLSTIKFKDGDKLAMSLFAHTTDKIIAFASDGRAFTLAGDKLPGGRGLGEPLRLSIELGEEDHLVTMFLAQENSQHLVASDAGYGFMVDDSEFVALRKAGKQILNLDTKGRAVACTPVMGDAVAVVGSHRKLLVFGTEELPVMGRGKGVKLQAYKDAKLADVKVFERKDGLSWVDGSGRTREVPEWETYIGKRASVGRMVPRGFSKSGTFTG